MTRIMVIAVIGGAAAARLGDPVRAMQAEIDELERKLEVVSARVDQLTRSSEGVTRFAGSKFPAPFEIVDGSGKPLIRVVQNPEHKGGVITLWNGGKEHVWISATAEGGFLKAKSKAGFPELAVGTVGALYSGLFIRDAAEQFRAGLFLENGKPYLALRNENYISVALISQGAPGGGLLELTDAAGNAQMRAGVTASGCGRVETYPERPGNTRVVGAPSSFIVGNCK